MSVQCRCDISFLDCDMQTKIEKKSRRNEQKSTLSIEVKRSWRINDILCQPWRILMNIYKIMVHAMYLFSGTDCHSFRVGFSNAFAVLVLLVEKHVLWLRVFTFLFAYWMHEYTPQCGPFFSVGCHLQRSQTKPQSIWRLSNGGRADAFEHTIIYTRNIDWTWHLFMLEAEHS